MDFLLIIGVNLVVYFRTVGFDLVVDDRRRYESLDVLKRPYTPKRIFDFIVLRLHASGTFGKNKKLDHLVTLALHALVCCLIYLVFGKTQTSFMAALLFAVNPSNNQGAVWMHGRRYVFNTIIVLVAWHLRPYGLLLYVLTPLLQSNAFAMPLLFGAPWLLPAFLILFRNRIPEWIKTRSRNIPKDSPLIELSPRKVILFLKSYFVYFTRSLTAQKPCMYVPYLEKYGLTEQDDEECFETDKKMWAGLALLSLTVSLIILNWGTPLGFGLFWFLIFIVQWCNLITFTQTFAERYLYLPNVGMMLALSYILGQWSWAPILVYSAVLSTSLYMYKDLCTFFEYHTHHFPGHAIPFIVLTKLYFSAEDYVESIHWVQEGRHHHKTNFILWYYSAVLLARLKEKKRALEAVNEAYKYIPRGKEKMKQNLEKLREMIIDTI